MRKITPTENTRLQKTQEDSFFDECQIGIYQETTDSYGDLLKSWNYGSSIACGVELTNGYEKVNGELVYTGVTAKVRLPKNTNISTRDRIKINNVAYGVRTILGKYCLVVVCENLGV